MTARGDQKKNTDNQVHISVVTPVYGYELNLDTLYARLRDSLSNFTDDFEIIMVNDASPDNAWEVITELSGNDSRVRGINLSRNFGQHHAITAGLDHTRGEWVVVMDCDLQDQPEEIVKLYEKAREGYDIVFGRRVERNDPFIKFVFSKLFHKTLNFFSGINHDPTVSNFGIYSKKIIDAIRRYRERRQAFGIFIHHAGFRKTSMPVEHSERTTGKSAYTLRRRFGFAIDTIVSNSATPLRFSIGLGFLMFAVSFTCALWLVFRYLFQGVMVLGWTSLMVSICLIGGLLFMNMGFLGLYIGKIFDETKKRPLYLIQETTFDDFRGFSKE
ncbi:Glycosyltransferase [Candidatus Desulfarcum epimagneticum]|uniref:Glycosyltransferase n=1 Tax=uncultured Desulfobacteraceae bacterium TaxID=218296 RepID=A0A484HHI1_9BACT|nr:Glycosyltransferase [uncultured Desulfobacteraceae bacterium]